MFGTKLKQRWNSRMMRPASVTNVVGAHFEKLEPRLFLSGAVTVAPPTLPTFPLSINGVAVLQYAEVSTPVGAVIPPTLATLPLSINGVPVPAAPAAPAVDLTVQYAEMTTPPGIVAPPTLLILPLSINGVAVPQQAEVTTPVGTVTPPTLPTSQASIGSPVVVINLLPAVVVNIPNVFPPGETPTEAIAALSSSGTVINSLPAVVVTVPNVFPPGDLPSTAIGVLAGAGSDTLAAGSSDSSSLLG